MTPNKPYLLRAFYEWIVDNHCTPYVLVDAYYPGVLVPQAYVQNGQIVLNISPEACRGLVMENDRMVFSARFAGQVEQIFLPPLSILEIYAKENGRGISFPPEEAPPPPSEPSPQKRTSVKPTLKLVEPPKE
jgi:stringent starvation protein B